MAIPHPFCMFLCHLRRRSEPNQMGFVRLPLSLPVRKSVWTPHLFPLPKDAEDRTTQLRNQQKLLSAMRDIPQQMASFLPASCRTGRFSEEVGDAVKTTAQEHTTTMIQCLREQKEKDVVVGDLTRLLDQMTFVEQRESPDQGRTRSICSCDTRNLEAAARKEKILELLDSFAGDEESRVSLNAIKEKINRNWTPGADLSHIIVTSLPHQGKGLPSHLRVVSK